MIDSLHDDMEGSYLVDELKEWYHTDPLIYRCLTMQSKTGLSSRATLIMLVKMMADRNNQLEQRLMTLMVQLPPASEQR